MPPDHHHHHHHGGVHQEPPKPNQKFLSLILKALIMTLVTSLFFLFLGVAAILLLLFLAGGALHRRRRRHRHHPSRLRSSSSSSSSSLSPRDLRRLPQFRFAAGTETGTTDCVICLDALGEGQWCRRLGACGHVFHRRCLDAWLIKVPACPICRTRVRLDLGDRASSSSGELEEEAKRWWGFDANNGFQGLVGM